MRNGNLFLVLISLLCCGFTWGQVQSGKIVYELTPNQKDSLVSGKVKKSEFQKTFLAFGPTVEFELLFNESASLYKMSERLSVGQESMDEAMTIFLLGGKNIYYTDLIHKKQTIQQEKFGGFTRIATDIDDLHWNLTNESKKISGYKCYKAEGIRYGTNKHFETTEIPLVAWYCPELSYPFGPYEAVGLPGLVLQFEKGKFIYTASDISFSPESILVEESKEGVLTTQQEINEKLKKRVKGFD